MKELRVEALRQAVVVYGDRAYEDVHEDIVEAAQAFLAFLTGEAVEITRDPRTDPTGHKHGQVPR